MAAPSVLLATPVAAAAARSESAQAHEFLAHSSRSRPSPFKVTTCPRSASRPATLDARTAHERRQRSARATSAAAKPSPGRTASLRSSSVPGLVAGAWASRRSPRRAVPERRARTPMSAPGPGASRPRAPNDNGAMIALAGEDVAGLRSDREASVRHPPRPPPPGSWRARRVLERSVVARGTSRPARRAARPGRSQAPRA